MTDKEYIEKLRRFNSTDKYFQELYMMYGLIQPMRHQKILDFGCGIGTALKYFKNISDRVSFMGYDVNDYMRKVSPYSHHLFTPVINDEYHTVYFMHSFAHIPDVSRVVFDLRERVIDKVIVVTPNIKWLNLQANESYTPDPTIVKHYDAEELRDIFDDAGYRVTLEGGFGNCVAGQYERLFIIAKP